MRNPTCAQAFSDSLFVGDERTGPLAACSHVVLLPVAASAFHSPGAAFPVPVSAVLVLVPVVLDHVPVVLDHVQGVLALVPIVPSPVAELRSPCGVARCPDPRHTTPLARKRSSVST